jgi:peptidoglycan/LPS O-acetylase OafA/YrhL
MSAPRTDFNIPLNGYRGLCAGLVFVHHLGTAGVVPWPSGSAIADGATFLWRGLQYGVEMFFMISGFVILSSLVRHGNISRFLRDRVLRIFSAWVPALMAVTLVCAVLRMKLFTDIGIGEAAALILANVLLLPPLIPMQLIHPVSWSLTYEWVFYLSAALGFAVLRLRHRWTIALWIAASLLFVCLYPRATFFIVGVLVFKYRDWFSTHRHWLRWPAVSLLVFLIAWGLTGVEKAHLTETWFDWLIDGRWIAGLVAFVAGLHMFASVTVSASRQSAFLSGRTFQFLGTISYSFYLWHTLLISTVKRVITPYIVPEVGVATAFVLFTVLSLAISIPLAWASWRTFEVHLATRLRRRLEPSRSVGEPIRAT